MALEERTELGVAHLDADAFYVSIELRRRPELRGRPVVVSGTGPRAVVTTASYEARRYGVGSAMPASRARRLCPDLIFAPPRFDAYRAASNAIRAIFAEYSEFVEPLSLDEAYLDVTANLRGLHSASATGADIRARIFAETGLLRRRGFPTTNFWPSSPPITANPMGSSW